MIVGVLGRGGHLKIAVVSEHPEAMDPRVPMQVRVGQALAQKVGASAVVRCDAADRGEQFFARLLLLLHGLRHEQTVPRRNNVARVLLQKDLDFGLLQRRGFRDRGTVGFRDDVVGNDGRLGEQELPRNDGETR